MMKTKTKTVAGQPSWILRSKDVELAITQTGGHMAPVRFHLRTKPVQPYYVSPWQDEKLDIDEPVLEPLRGDFFCMPFGANGNYRGKDYPVHGESATGAWDLGGATQHGDAVTLELTMRTKKLPGRITKSISLIDGQNVIYIQHVLEGYSGKVPLGHHAILAMPEEPESMLVSTSPIRFGRTSPTPTGLPDGPEGEYQSLAVDRRFADLRRVPLIWDRRKGDCSAFPTRPGFTDILAVFNKPRKSPAWTTAVFETEGYLWFALKDVDALPSTVLWIANRGRHGAPWNGRNVCLGVEDVCAYFPEGYGPSVKKNPISEQGIPTAVKLSKRKATAINHVQGVVKTPRGFGRVRTARFREGEVTFVSESGKEVTAEVNHAFLTTGEIGV